MNLEVTWHQLRERLQERGLWSEDASLALRVPGRDEAWWGQGQADPPQRLALADVQAPASARVHAQVFAARADALATAWCAGPAGRALAGLAAPMPQCFDEQARHLGPFVHAQADALAPALAARGQVLSLQGRLLCLAPTAPRLCLNAELMEKCATAALLAWGASDEVPALPAWVRWIANRRLRRDQRRASAALARGDLPPETAGY